MTDFANPFFWLNFVYFFFAIFLAFVVPGWVILKNVELTTPLKLVLAATVGMVLFAWQGIVFGYLHVRELSYVYLLVFLILWVRDMRKNPIKIDFKHLKLDYLLLLIIIAGMFFQLSSVWFNGVRIGNDMYFCCGDVRDNILHMAIVNEALKNIPPFEPGYYGKLITNYHYWSSIVVAELVRIFRLPLIATDYQYMSFLISLLLGLNLIVVSALLKMSKNFVRWLTFFFYFGSDLVWVFVLIFRGNQIFNMSAMESGPKFLENLPRAYAVVVLIAGLSLFLIWLKKRDIKLGITLALTFASLAGFKIYNALFVMPGFLLYGVYSFFKKDFKSVLLVIFTVILTVIVYIPVNSGAGGLIYTGMWRFENFIVQPYFGSLQRLELARVIYLTHNNYVRNIGYELLYVAIFVVATFGLKLLGFFQNKKSVKSFPFGFNLILIAGILVSAIAGSFFTQTSGGANTFNFLVAVFIFGSFYTALALTYWTEKFPRLITALIILVIVGLSLPRDINELYVNAKNISTKQGFTISSQELLALKNLSEIKTDKLVVVDPVIYMDYQIPYVGFLSNKKMFLSGRGDSLEVHSVDFKDRAKALSFIIRSSDPKLVASTLLANNIGYIYRPSFQILSASQSANFLDIIFINEKIKILKVDEQKAKDFLIKSND